MNLSMGYDTAMSYEDRARRRIATWLDTHPKVTQRMVAEAAGHLQPWVSSYRKGLVTAGLDELAGMASAFGHTLAELLDLRPDTAEQDLIDAYRSIPPERREDARRFVWALAPKTPPRGRQTAHTRSGAPAPSSAPTTADTSARRGTRKGKA